MAIQIISKSLSFTYIGGKSIYALPHIIRCQTDASFSRKGIFISALAIRPNSTRIEKLVQKYGITDSTEAEWASIHLGLVTCMEENYSVIGIENDNLSIISQLIFKDNTPHRAYAKHFRHKIYELAKNTSWTGVRWIPRELNHADEILRRG